MSQPVNIPDKIPLSECFASIDSVEGHRQVSLYLASQPYPHFEPAPGKPGVLVRVERDGTRILGRFVGRKFQVVKSLK
jgi:hypothetical protein